MAASRKRRGPTPPVPSREDDRRRQDEGGRRSLRHRDPPGPRPEARPGRGADPRPRDGRLRLGQAHLPVGRVDGGHVQAAAHLRPRVLRRDRRVRPGRQAAAPRGGPVRLGRDARHRGACRPCLTGRRHICENTRILGVHGDGCFAQYVVVPAFNVVPLDRDDDPAEGRRVPRRARQRRPHDAGGRPLRQVGRGPRLRADRRDVRRDRAHLGRRAHRDHRGQRPRRRARPQVGEVARR